MFADGYVQSNYADYQAHSTLRGEEDDQLYIAIVFDLVRPFATFREFVVCHVYHDAVFHL